MHPKGNKRRYRTLSRQVKALPRFRNLEIDIPPCPLSMGYRRGRRDPKKRRPVARNEGNRATEHLST